MWRTADQWVKMEFSECRSQTEEGRGVFFKGAVRGETRVFLDQLLSGGGTELERDQELASRSSHQTGAWSLGIGRAQNGREVGDCKGKTRVGWP